MSFVFEEIKITDEFTGVGGGGVPYINGGVLGKHLATIRGYFYLAYMGKFLRFSAAEKSIENINQLDFSSFKDDPITGVVGKGLAPGRIITFENAHAENNHSFTVVSISNDGRKIYVAETVFTDDHNGVDIYDDAIIEAIDFYYNLIPNNSQESYLSLTDKQAIQRFTADSLYASDPAPINMLVASSSFGWVTNKLSNETTGETNEVIIEGGEIVGHKQHFIIKQYFKIAPFAMAEQLRNFQDITPIDYFKDGQALKYICRVDGKFDFTNPDIPHTGSSTANNGLSNWFNQNNIRSRPEYYFESITYKDAYNVALDSLDINKVVTVDLIVRSRNGKFINNEAFKTEFALDFVYLPLNESRYVDTPDTTLVQNLLSDRKFMAVNVGGNGENYGSAYQVIKQIQPTVTNATTLTINFKVDFSAAIKTLLKTLPQENRNFFFALTTQAAQITTTVQTDRVPILVPLNQIKWDKSDTTIIEAVDNARIYHFPQIGTGRRTTVSGYEGDPVYIEFPFRVKQSYAEIMKSGFQIVAFKVGEDDFVLEEKIFDSSLVRKLEGVQTIDISEVKNFRDMPYEYNVSFLRRDVSFNEINSGSGESSYAGFLPHHAFVLRYAFWNKLIQDAERFRYAIFDDIETPTEAWNTLQSNGWALAVRFVAEIKNNEGFTETFDQYWAIDTKALGTAPDSGPVFESTVQYMDVATNLIVPGIVAGGKTNIKRIFTGNFTNTPAGYNSVFGYIFADIETQGGITTKRFASSEFDSEDDSPFIAPPYTPEEGNIPNHSWASKNFRINIFNFTKIIIETIYDDTKNDWSFRAGAILFFPRLGFMSGCFIKTEAGGYVLNESGQRINLETCES